MRPPLPCLLLALAGLGLGSARAGAPEQPLVTVTAVAERDQLVPGQAMWVGLRYEIAPGWHIYWENPGDSGLATTVELAPGPGLTTGPLRWPGPDRFDLPGGIANFGYHEEVVLLTELTPRAQLRVGERARVAWSTTWLACKEACVRGEAEGTLELPVGSVATSRRSEVLDAWVRRLPAGAENVGAVERWQGPASAPERVVFVRGATRALFFPSRALLDALSSERIEPGPEGVTLTLTVDPARLSIDARGVLRVESAEGVRWIELRLPLPPTTP